MIIPPEIPTLYWENEETGEIVLPDFKEGFPQWPGDDWIQISRFPCQVVTNFTKPGDSRSSSAASTYPEELVEAMVRQGWRLGRAALVASMACERCLNVLCYEFDVPAGYHEGSSEWQQCRTVCEFCQHLGDPNDSQRERRLVREEREREEPRGTVPD